MYTVHAAADTGFVPARTGLITTNHPDFTRIIADVFLQGDLLEADFDIDLRIDGDPHFVFRPLRSGQTVFGRTNGYFTVTPSMLVNTGWSGFGRRAFGVHVVHDYYQDGSARTQLFLEHKGSSLRLDDLPFPMLTPQYDKLFSFVATLMERLVPILLRRRPPTIDIVVFDGTTVDGRHGHFEPIGDVRLELLDDYVAPDPDGSQRISATQIIYDGRRTCSEPS